MFNTQASQEAAVLHVRQKKDPAFNLNLKLIKFNSLNQESHTPAHLLGVSKDVWVSSETLRGLCSALVFTYRCPWARLRGLDSIISELN